MLPPSRHLAWISIHKALASLDVTPSGPYSSSKSFQSTRLSRASTISPQNVNFSVFISIHKALASLDQIPSSDWLHLPISIHKALASLDSMSSQSSRPRHYFNPQGSREPRQDSLISDPLDKNFNPQGSREPRLLALMVPLSPPLFQSTRLSRASTTGTMQYARETQNFNPQGSREPRPKYSYGTSA